MTRFDRAQPRMKELVKLGLGRGQIYETLKEEKLSYRKTVLLKDVKKLQDEHIAEARIKERPKDLTKYTPKKYIDKRKHILLSVHSTIGTRKEDIEPEFKILTMEMKKKTKKELIEKLKGMEEPEKIYMGLNTEIFSDDGEARESLLMEEKEEYFLMGEIFPISREKDILVFLNTAQEISGNTFDFKNSLLIKAQDTDNKKFKNFVEEVIKDVG